MYPKNEVHTNRYNAFTFLPKCLFEQFRRLANVYFVVIGIIASVGYYGGFYESALEPAAVLAPVSIVVLISVLKEGVEDYKRQQADVKVNGRPANVVSPDGTIITAQWKDLDVGSIVLLQDNEEIPADIVLLASGGIGGNTAYVDTAAIDGETNLKIRLPSLSIDTEKHKSTDGSEIAAYDTSITVCQNKTTVTGVAELKISVQAELPNNSIHHFDGSVEFTDAKNLIHKSTLAEKNLLLRGAVIRATEWCVGMVVYTGGETKLSLNSRAPPSKLSSVDRVVNRALAIAIGVMVLVCFISMSLSIMWDNSNKNCFYLCLNTDDLSPAYSSVDNGGCTNSQPSSILTIFTFATLYNNFVCISMYVSLEMIYLCQAYFIQNDLNLYDPVTDTPAECHTSGMCADIGQVQYVLSDKTGTLTKNNMTLRRCSIAGSIYGAPIKPPNFGDEDSSSNLSQSASSPALETEADDEIANPLQTGIKMIERPSALTAVATKKDYFELRDMAAHRLLGTNNANILSECLWNLAVCNTVMLMPDAKTGNLNIANKTELQKCLQAESPDEVALVLAAAEYGDELLVKSEVTETVVRSFGRPKPDSGKDEFLFKVLAVNEFESDRKRMSVLIRRGTAPPVLYCKGADTSMLPNCLTSEHTPTCLRDINSFAVTGLRTLVMSRRILTEKQAEKWLASYKAASNNIGKRKELLSDCALEIEQDMELLGAVGIEDELQDNVASSIQTLQNAGLNVWMITGDKPETAIAISQMCSLLRPSHQVHEIVGKTGAELLQRIQEITKIAEDEKREKQKREDLHKLVNTMTPFEEWCESSGMTAIVERLRTAIFGAPPTRAGSPPVSTKKKSIAGGMEESDISNLALVIDGISLEGIWTSEDMKFQFTSAVASFPTVVACRVSPLQKASLVKMVKNGAGLPITLAIGDGANDVGMIHEAKVGVGISGKEGRHAANSADFAIAQFSFLIPLLFHHGRFNYIRCSKLVLYSFFKNLCIVSILFYYCFYSGFSGTIPLDSFVLSGYNFYLGLPIVALGALDFDVRKEDVMRFPRLAYNTGRLGEMLNNWNMLKWCTFSFFYGMLFYTVLIRFFTGEMSYRKENDSNVGYLPMEGIGNVNSKGQDGGIYTEGFMMFSVVITAMQYKVVMMTHTMTYINWLVWWLSFCGYFFFSYIYSFISNGLWYGVVEFDFPQSNFWLAMFMVPIMFAIADYLVDDAIAIFYPTSRDILVKKIKEFEAQQQQPQTQTQSHLLHQTPEAARKVVAARGTTNSITDTL